jgi:uncharacterized FlgJ-related protein
MIYYFDKKDLIYRRLELKWIYVLTAMFFAIMLMMSTAKPDVIVKHKIINKDKLIEVGPLAFSQENFYQYIKKCGIKFPHIVMAQALVETARFKSNIFIHSHNAFGMKVAKSRPTTALGESRGHAHYQHWTFSVQDYALFQSAFLRKIKNEEDYYQYLADNYAEDPNYVSKLKQIAEKYK